MSKSTSHVLALATIAIAFVGAATSAIAVEATQYVAPGGTLTRAEVQAELRGAPAAKVQAVQLGEATQFADAPASRHAFAQAPAASTSATQVIQLGEATVFVDAPGTRSREAVRAEARTATRSSRGDNTYSGS